MSNYRILFYGTKTNGTNDHVLECYKNTKSEIFINIEISKEQNAFICLDKSTAIKFAKTLRTEINKIQ